MSTRAVVAVGTPRECQERINEEIKFWSNLVKSDDLHTATIAAARLKSAEQTLNTWLTS
jgi:hypothetical protein